MLLVFLVLVVWFDLLLSWSFLEGWLLSVGFLFVSLFVVLLALGLLGFLVCFGFFQKSYTYFLCHL